MSEYPPEEIARLSVWGSLLNAVCNEDGTITILFPADAEETKPV